jgi:competence protein ComFC
MFLTLKCVYELFSTNNGRMGSLKLEFLSKWWQDLGHLLYPDTCLVCDNELPSAKNSTCFSCQTEFHFTYFEKFQEPTPLDQLFWGRVPLQGSYSLLYFEKGKSVQPVLHALKYQNKPTIGLEMGALMGKKIKTISTFKDLEALVPVPLHPQKEFKRGYNQSKMIADGLSSVLHLPVVEDLIIRRENTASQTSKGVISRWENVENKFTTSQKGRLKFQHIALVDDVITTGATLEAIIRALFENYPQIRISVFSLALTK